MRLLSKTKDGGKKSKVWAYWLVEIKGLLSIAILRFDNGSRDAYHTHAFHCISWIIRGKLLEEFVDGRVNRYSRSIKPIITKKQDFHRVTSEGRTWAFTIRGPWSKTWLELDEERDRLTLSNGRVVEKRVSAK